jgi:predicted PurR-regulated permease PerM
VTVTGGPDVPAGTESAADPVSGVGPRSLGALLTRAGVAAWSVVGMLVAAYLVLLVVARLRILLAPVVLAVVLIYLLNPVVSRLASIGVHRVLGSLSAFAALLGVIVLLGFLVLPAIAEQAGDLTDRFPELYATSIDQLEGLLEDFGFGGIDLWTYDELQEFLSEPENQDQIIAAALDNLGAITSGLFEAVLVFLVAPAVAFYVLIDLPRIRSESTDLVPPRHRAEAVHLTREVGTAVGGFLRGQVLVAAIVGVLTSVGFRAIGLEFWLLIGLISGFLNIIPFVGPWVGGALGVFAGLVVNADVRVAVLAALVALGVQQIDNHFVSPMVMRATVRLHPAVVVLILILGGATGGVWGVLLAVPVAASIKIIFGHFWRTRVLGQSWEQAREALFEESAVAERVWPMAGRGDSGDSTEEPATVVDTLEPEDPNGRRDQPD